MLITFSPYGLFQLQAVHDLNSVILKCLNMDPLEFKQAISQHIRGTLDGSTKFPPIPTDYLSALSDLKRIYDSEITFRNQAGSSAQYDADQFKARIEAYKIVWRKQFSKLMDDVRVSRGELKPRSSTKKIFIVNRGTFKKYCKEHNFDPAEIEKDDDVGQAITHILTMRPIDPETRKLITVYAYLRRNGYTEVRAAHAVRSSSKVSKQTQAIVKAQKEAEVSGSLTGAYF